MGIDPDQLGHSGGTLAELGYLAERAAHVVGPASSALGRVAAAISIVRLGTRLIPAGGRLLRRYPAGSLLVVAGFLAALYLLRSPPQPSHPPPG